MCYFLHFIFYWTKGQFILLSRVYDAAKLVEKTAVKKLDTTAYKRRQLVVWRCNCGETPIQKHKCSRRRRTPAVASTQSRHSSINWPLICIMSDGANKLFSSHSGRKS